MRILLILFLLNLISCERHEYESSVKEQELIQAEELDETENLYKAYLEKDYDKLEKIIKKGGYINKPLQEGKNLLYLSVENLDFQMIQFLLDLGAEPELELTINNIETTVKEFVEKMEDVILKGNLLQLLDGKFSEIAGNLFKDYLLDISAGEEYDKDWISFLLSYPLGLEELDEKDFSKVFMKKASLASNYQIIFQLVFSKKYSESSLKNWIDWMEGPFISGKYRKAECKFDLDNPCTKFDEFVLTCSDRFQSRMERAKAKILPFLDLRNVLYHCD